MKTVYPFGYVTNLLYICGKIKEETGQGTGRCPAEDTEVRKRTVLGKQQLFTHCKFKDEFIKLKQVP